MTFEELVAWAETLPQTPPSDTPSDTFSFAVPYQTGDFEGESAARLLAVAYMRSALEFLVAERGTLQLVRTLQEDITQVEKAPDNFWGPVVRAGWAFYRISCRVSQHQHHEAAECSVVHH